VSLKNITFKDLSILILLIVFIYFLLQNKNENLETCIKISETCRRINDTDNCCKGLVCNQNECKPVDKVKDRTKLSIETITDMRNKFISEIDNRGYSTSPKVEEKIKSEIKSESKSEIKFDTIDSDSDSDIDISKKMSTKLSRSCVCKCDDVNTSKDEDDKNKPSDINNINKPIIVKSSKKMGEYCTIDNECLSDKCSNEYNTCVFKLDGEDCLVGSQCVSQKCDTKTKKCVKKDISEACIFGNQCKSGNCNSKLNCNKDIPGDCNAICQNI